MKWISVDDQLPDADETVLLFMPEAEGEPIWPGYFECYGSCQWLLADGMPAGNVTHWMRFPDGPGVLA